eukprot:1321345-Rhodomonas_salina.1
MLLVTGHVPGTRLVTSQAGGVVTARACDVTTLACDVTTLEKTPQNARVSAGESAVSSRLLGRRTRPALSLALSSGEGGTTKINVTPKQLECAERCFNNNLHSGVAASIQGDVGEHIKQCENVVVSCPFAEHGRLEQGKRKAILDHEEEAAVVHSRLAARRAGRGGERVVMLEKEVTKLKESLADESEQVRQELDVEVRQLKQTLSQTKNELTQAVAQKTSEVRKLEEELEESKRRVAALDQQLAASLQATGGQSYGVAGG